MRKKYSTTRQLIGFDTPYLHDPAWQTLRVLPDRYDKIVEDFDKCYNEFIKFSNFS